MFELLVNNQVGLQNVYTPLPFKIHLAFCILATVVYLVQFYRKHSAYYLFIMFAIDLTFITQYSTGKGVVIALFAAEVVLIVLAIVSAVLNNKKKKAANAAADAVRKQELEDKKNAENNAAEHDKKIVDNAFDDEELK